MHKLLNFAANKNYHNSEIDSKNHQLTSNKNHVVAISKICILASCFSKLINASGK